MTEPMKNAPSMARKGGIRKGATMKRLSPVLFAMLLEELVSGPSTWRELSDHTGLSRNTILTALDAMHKRDLIYVAGWEKDARGASTIRAFAFGKKPDAPRPKKTQAEVNRAFRQRHGVTSLRTNIFQQVAA